MNLFQKLFSRHPEDEAALESESAFSRELFLGKPEHWYLIVYGEFLRTRRTVIVRLYSGRSFPRVLGSRK